MLRNVVFAIPVVGWMLKSAWYGDLVEKLFFLANVFVVWAFAIYFFGPAAFIVPLLGLVGIYLIGMVVLTAGDLFSGAGASRPAVVPAEGHGRAADGRNNLRLAARPAGTRSGTPSTQHR